MAAVRYIISDLHLGDGSELDDFKQDIQFRHFVQELGRKRKAELIINGDFIDFLAISLPEESPRPFSRLGNTEEESLRKLEMVLDAHPLVFDSLRGFIQEGNRLVIIPGNHDIDLFWPKLWERMAEALGNPDGERLYFERNGIYRIDNLYVEHGNQYFNDSLFGNFTHPFLRDPRTGELRLERSWGSCFMTYFANSMRKSKPFIDNVKPISSLVFLGMQEETWWFRIKHAYKLSHFILRVGFPPLREVRASLCESSECREPPGHSRKRVLRGFKSLSGLYRRNHSGEDDAFLDLVDREVDLGEVAVEAQEQGIKLEVEQHYPQGLAGTAQEEEEKGGDEEGPREEEPLVLDPLSTREDILSVRARELLLEDDGPDVVIFGHDHRYFSNQYAPTVGGKKGKYYINTGTWIPMLFLTRTQKNLSWKDLEDRRLYHLHLTFAEVKSALGRHSAQLKSLQG